MAALSLQLSRLEAIASAAGDLERAGGFRAAILSLLPATEYDERVGKHLGDSVLMYMTGRHTSPRPVLSIPAPPWRPKAPPAWGSVALQEVTATGGVKPYGEGDALCSGQ